jgi:hypothetical protein
VIEALTRLATLRPGDASLDGRPYLVAVDFAALFLVFVDRLVVFFAVVFFGERVFFVAFFAVFFVAAISLAPFESGRPARSVTCTFPRTPCQGSRNYRCIGRVLVAAPVG